MLESIERNFFKGREIEAIHGAGSLLELEDSSVLGCIDRGLISEEHRRSAERY
ncbi:hypothetical protein GR223_29345 [Rhizobium leguminosarum]|uniref:hypothetical protein n=1 Tax=Rhizobium ruizarguesonis TaxID=2081791 RepID=UPI0013E04C79|nr:hypothetical protein [Rhizobium ruizarguesonis]NEJ90000.1 hypothetical protein [Rhizobium ruizarguesonis]